MYDDLALYLMLVAALAIGYLLGRRDLPKRPPDVRAPERYFTSFSQLVNEQHDLDIDTFVDALVHHDDGVDTRLALGSLVRRRGEVDKAIRIHQGLLARPALSVEQRAQIELELARDYMAAGLLGRAENLLLELARGSGAQRAVAQRALLEIYQREREWRQAVKVGREIARSDRGVNARLAHLQCELAEQAMAAGDLRQAREELAEGADFDTDCARVSLLGAQVELAAGRHRDARRLLRRAVRQDPDCVPLAVAPYRRACEAMHDSAAFVAFLEECLKLGAYLPAVQAMAEHLAGTCGVTAASQFVTEQLLRSPSLGGFVTLLEHLQRDGAPLGAERLALVRRFSEALLEKQAVYRCRNCGFSSRSLMWQCPSCHEWGSCKPVTATARP